MSAQALIERLVAAGCDPIVAGSVIAEAMVSVAADLLDTRGETQRAKAAKRQRDYQARKREQSRHLTSSDVNDVITPLDKGASEVPPQTPLPTSSKTQPLKENPLKGSKEKTPKGAVASDFERFWDPWVPKKSKGQAEKTFSKLAEREELPPLDDLLAAVERTRMDHRWLDGLAPHASTWLNAKGWLDEVEPPRPHRRRQAAESAPISEEEGLSNDPKFRSRIANMQRSLNGARNMLERERCGDDRERGIALGGSEGEPACVPSGHDGAGWT